MKEIVRGVRYSMGLLYRSSGLTILLCYLLQTISVTIPLANTYIVKLLLDELTSPDHREQYIYAYVLAFVLSLVLQNALNSIYTIVNKTMLDKVRLTSTTEFLEKVKQLPMAVIDSTEGGKMISGGWRGRDHCTYLFNRVIELVTAAYSFILVCTTLFAFNVGYALLYFVLTVPGIVVNAAYEKKNNKILIESYETQQKANRYRWILTGAPSAKDVRMYNLAEPLKERYDTERNISRKLNLSLHRKILSSSLATETLRHAGEVIFTIFVITEALRDAVTVGNVALYIGFAVSASSSFQAVMTKVIYLATITPEQMTMASEFMDFECPDKRSGIRALESFESLEFDDVYFKYPYTDKYVLSGVSFVLNKGDTMSIVGVNGAGKSTIVKIMIGIYPPDSGGILINGHPMGEYDIGDVRKVFSVLFQNFVQYSLTVRENIALSDISRMGNDAEIIDALRKGDIYSKLAEGGESDAEMLGRYMSRQFDDGGIELSRGQWQKVALARIYFKDAPVIIFDEPSAALDAEAEDRIFQNFEEVAQNKTGIMISHRMSSARASNKVIVLDGGKITESGTHDELVAHEGSLYARLYNLQKEKYSVRSEVT